MLSQKFPPRVLFSYRSDKFVTRYFSLFSCSLSDIRKNAEALDCQGFRHFHFSRSDGIRTHDLCVPNAALYQTEPRFDFVCILNSRPSTIAIIYDVYRNVNIFFEIFLIFFYYCFKRYILCGFAAFLCSFEITVSEKFKKEICWKFCSGISLIFVSQLS